MAATSCIYKSVIMGPGETFVLPPGAELVSVSDIGALTSSCPDEFPTEELKCYRIAWAFNIDPEGNRTIKAIVSQSGSPFPPGPGFALAHVPNTGGAWEDTDNDTAPINIDKISIGGTVITGGFSASNFASLDATIASSPMSGILTERKYNHYDTIQPLTALEDGQWGHWWRSGFVMYTMHFKSIPSLAGTVYLEFLSALNADGGNIGSIPRYFAQEVDCLTYPVTTEI